MKFVSSNTRVAPNQRTVTKTEAETLWKVIVLNDPVNLMSYVVMVFRKVFGYDETRARTHMLEVHEQGRSVVWAGSRERAETYVHTLQTWQLNTILEKE
jgi:ATP-dependent Clp protease adaptor protein ClpS